VIAFTEDALIIKSKDDTASYGIAPELLKGPGKFLALASLPTPVEVNISVGNIVSLKKIK
jgi:hypothetical protein